MTNPMQSDPDRLRLALDNGEEVELDGGTLALSDEESPLVLLRFLATQAATLTRRLVLVRSLATPRASSTRRSVRAPSQISLPVAITRPSA